MERRLLKSKIHRARVTDANLEYEGSVTLDSALMELANIAPWEVVAIWDVTNGERIETYVVPGKAGTGVVCINGAAAHKIHKGDIVILASFANYTEERAWDHNPKRIFVDANDNNKVLAT